MTNTNLLKSKMAAFGDTEFVSALAKILCISRSTASRKLSGDKAFSQSEIVVIAQKYGLSAEEIKEIFVDGVE